MQVDDGHGGIVTQPVTITVTGTNDTPVITSGTQAGAITERFNTPQPNPTGSTTADTATGTVTFTDVDLSDHHTVSITGVVASGITSGLPDNATLKGWLSLGTLHDTTGTGLGGSDAWTFSAQDKSFDYLAAGETLTLTYTVQVDDGHGGVVTQPVTITVTGTNDTPVITSGTQTGTITERFNTPQPNPTGSTTADTATGNDHLHRRRPQRPPHGDDHRRCRLGHHDSGLPDNTTLKGWLSLGTLHDTTGSGLGGSDAWTFSAKDKSFDYLAAGEILTLTYTVQVDDGHGGIVTQPVTITITGTNDSPTITAGSTTATGAITELAATTGSSTSDSSTGSIAFADPDLSDHHSVTPSGPAFAWSGGSLSAGQITALTNASTLKLTETDSTGTGSGSVAWNYSAADKTFDFLAAGQTLTITYALTIADGHGGSVVQNVVETVTGTNDAPSIVASATDATGAFTHDDHRPDTANGSIGFADVDLSDHHTVSISGPTFSVSLGTLSPREVLARQRQYYVAERDRQHRIRDRRGGVELQPDGFRRRLAGSRSEADGDLYGDDCRRSWRQHQPGRRGDRHRRLGFRHGSGGRGWIRNQPGPDPVRRRQQHGRYRRGSAAQLDDGRRHAQRGWLVDRADQRFFGVDDHA